MSGFKKNYSLWEFHSASCLNVADKSPQNSTPAKQTIDGNICRQKAKVKQHSCHKMYKKSIGRAWKCLTLKKPISHKKMAAFQELHDKFTSQVAWAWNTKDLRSPADLRLHLNKWFKHYSRAFNPFVIVQWDQSLTVSPHLIRWLQLSAPLEEKRAWTSELNEHVGIQWILICLYFRKSSGKKGEEIY